MLPQHDLLETLPYWYANYIFTIKSKFMSQQVPPWLKLECYLCFICYFQKKLPSGQ